VINPFIALMALMDYAQDRLKQEKGATAVEYGLMVGLIAAVIITTVILLGGQLNALFQRITAALSTAGVAVGGGGA
jgi:pilus assembly protein Flp/PilA